MEIEDLKLYSAICRGCLSESGEMKNMYEWGLSEDFHIFADITLQRSDNMSELLCTSCEQLLLSFRDFRRTCQQSDGILRQRSKELKKSTCEDTVQASQIQIDHQLTEKNLTINITTADMDTKIYLPCPYHCGRKFMKKKDLLRHFSKIHGVHNLEVNINYICPECLKRFPVRKNLNQHLTKVHKDKSLPCNKCNAMFPTEIMLKRHEETCDLIYLCSVCNVVYKTNERLLVHLLRKHPDLHKQYKQQRKSRLVENKSSVEDIKKPRLDVNIWDSPKRTSSTQTLDNIKNDVALPSWQTDRNFTHIDTQTCDDLMSLKSQNSEEDSIFYSETVSLSDIQTQTFPIEFGLSKTESETQTKHELSIKETQTCVCHYDSPKLSFKSFDSVSSSPNNLTSSQTQTQTYDKVSIKSDVLLSFNSAETQTCFDRNDL